MPRIPFPGFCGPTYSGAQTVFQSLDAQRSINLYPEKGYATSREPYFLIGRPGLSAFATLPTSPVRCMWAGYNRLFAVAGTHVYELSSGGGVLTDFGAMAGSTGLGPCKIVQNGATSAFQLIVFDSSSSQLYFVNPTGPAVTSVFNATDQEYLDGYQIAIATGASLVNAGQPNQINVSNFGDGTTWNALNFVIRTGSNDLVNGLAVLNSQLWIFGQKTIEVWYNAGNPLFPFARIPGATINLGCMSRDSIVKFYNTIMWLGADATGYPQVYMSKGLSPVRVSNAAIENLMSGSAPSLQSAWAFGYQESGHTFYCLNLTASPYSNISQTFVYDLNEGMWHERSYNIVSGPWPATFASSPGFNSTGLNFVGDFYSGKVMFQSIAYPSDLGASILYSRYAPYVTDNNEVSKHGRFELAGSFGTASPKLYWSNDQGLTYKSVARTLAQASDQGWPADQPTFQRFFANQLGRSRARIYLTQITDNANLIRIAGAYLDVDKGVGA